MPAGGQICPGGDSEQWEGVRSRQPVYHLYSLVCLCQVWELPRSVHRCQQVLLMGGGQAEDLGE